MEATRPLADIIANRRWLQRRRPFPHLVVPGLFTEPAAKEIEAAVRAVIDDEELHRIARYDAMGWGIPADVDWPLRLFLTEEWRALIARAVGVETTPYVSAGIHHHAVGGGNGSPHNDLNPVYFADAEPRDGIVGQRAELVDPKSGRAIVDGTTVVPTVRAVSVLYYTANAPWRPGDGGETGLYTRRTDPVERPAQVVPPRNNTLVAFACTPHSFHSFLSNRVSERNSITMWLHGSYEAAVARWGDHTLERWAESPPAADP